MLSTLTVFAGLDFQQLSPGAKAKGNQARQDGSTCPIDSDKKVFFVASIYLSLVCHVR